MSSFNIFLNTGEAAANNNTTTIVMVVILVVVLVGMMIVPIFSRRKQKKEVDQMMTGFGPGAVIKTVGGIIGKVISVNEISPVEKQMVIETGVGDNKTTMTFDTAALYQVLEPINRPIENTTHTTEESNTAEPDLSIKDEIAAENANSDTDTTVLPFSEDETVSSNAEEPKADDSIVNAAAETKTEVEAKPEVNTDTVEQTETTTEPAKVQEKAAKPAPKKPVSRKK